jgi:hypothetical protein
MFPATRHVRERFVDAIPPFTALPNAKVFADETPRQ